MPIRPTLALLLVLLTAASTGAGARAAADATARPTLPAVLWRGDYETGSLGQWSDQQSTRTSGEGAVGRSTIRVVRTPRRQGTFAARFATLPGAGAASDRAEVMLSRAKTGALEGRAYRYAWSTRFPRGQRFWPRYDLTNVFTQFHSVASNCFYPLQFGVDARRSPRLFAVVGNLADCGNARRWDLGALAFDRWYDFAVQIVWSSDPAAGRVEICVDGRRIVPPTPVATLAPGDGAYWKQGFYRFPWRSANVVYHDSARILRAAASAC